VTGVADNHYMESLIGYILGPIVTGSSKEHQGPEHKTTDKVVNQGRATRFVINNVRRLQRIMPELRQQLQQRPQQPTF
jgi:hypothetical protein